MPTYVYGCDACGHRFEIFQKFADAPLTECPECASRIRRIFQPAGIVFKGSGWYSKDSRASQATAKSDSEDGTKTADQPATAAKGEDAGKSTSKAASPAPAQAAD